MKVSSPATPLIFLGLDFWWSKILVTTHGKLSRDKLIPNRLVLNTSLTAESHYSLAISSMKMDLFAHALQLIIVSHSSFSEYVHSKYGPLCITTSLSFPARPRLLLTSLAEMRTSPLSLETLRPAPPNIVSAPQDVRLSRGKILHLKPFVSGCVRAVASMMAMSCRCPRSLSISPGIHRGSCRV